MPASRLHPKDLSVEVDQRVPGDPLVSFTDAKGHLVVVAGVILVGVRPVKADRSRARNVHRT